ncbi:MAG: cysteine desulfurase [Bacilli bacterium]|nr:cysteine desulfurase [Bacilli bacterium]
MNYKNDFPMLEKDIVYFDNGATTLKPKCVIDAICDYYTNYTSNAHRGDYKLSVKASNEYENVREKVKDLINAKNKDEIVFTSGSTESLNLVINGYFKNHLNKGDEVLITKSEHASNILPWYELENEIGIKVKYIPLTENHTVTIENLKMVVTDKTKVISIAHVTNVIGDVRPIKEIISYAHEKGILVVIDGAQSVGHTKVDVTSLDIDFLAFSAHKMLGPTGVGVLYGKYELLDEVKPLKYGGGMNIAFTSPKEIEYKDLPFRLEAGTQNIAGVIGFGKAIDYINKVGIDNIEETCDELKEYIVKKLKTLKNVKVYNENVEGSTIAFNINGIFAQDTAIYLDKYNICVRSGSHCAKKLEDELGIKNTCRISIYFYNTKEDADKLIEILDNDKILEESLGV